MKKHPNLIQRLRSNVIEIGAWNTVLYGADRLLKRINTRARIFRYILVAQPVTDQLLTPPRRGENIEVRLIQPDDPLLAMTLPPSTVIASRFSQGAVCFGAIKNSALIGYIWLCIGPYNEDEVKSKFIPEPAGQAAWDFDIYIDPKHRLGFAFPRLWDAANQYLAQNKCLWSMSRISAFNAQSLASHDRLGAHKVGSATYLCIGKWQLMVCSLKPRLHFSTNPDSIPNIHVVTAP